MKDVQAGIGLLPYWKYLSDDEKEYVLQNATMQRYEAGTILHGGGKKCLGMIFVLKGSIRAYLLSKEGREVTLFRLHAKDSCVLSASCAINQITFETQMTVEEECDLLLVDAGAFSLLAEQNVHVRCFLYELATQRFSTIVWVLQQIVFARFDQRLASFLLSEIERTGTDRIYFTQSQIAQHVNSAREVVSRTLKRFAADGMVEMKRGYILLKDTTALRQLL